MSRESSDRLFLVCGTAQERAVIARERGLRPEDIKLVQRFADIAGYRSGRLIIGNTGSYGDFGEIVAYAKTHGIGRAVKPRA